MTEKKTTMKEANVTSGDRKFPISTLRVNCTKMLHITSSTFAGATVGLEDGEYTISEVKKIINLWLKKEVK